MCTVTVVPWRGLVRLAANRDELRSRPAALPPESRPFGARQALFPIDPAAGGTWVAVSDAGLALALLNVNGDNGRTERARPPLSRGLVIPALLGAETLAAAVERAVSLDASAYAPFQLVLVDRNEVAVVRSGAECARLVLRGAQAAPMLFTSSGLGDGLVLAPRTKLFNAIFGPDDDWLAAQLAYHRHSWPDHAHLSVCMRRPDARTVSHTVVTLAPGQATLAYHPDAPDCPVEGCALQLTLRNGGAP